MLRMFVIASLLAALAFGFPRDITHTKLLSDTGVMSLDSLKFFAIEAFDVRFSGEVELTGVLEKDYEGEEEDSSLTLRFYPDTNLALPFLYDSLVGADELAKIDFTKQRENISVLILGVDHSALPEEFEKKIFGAVAARAKVRLKHYRFYGEGDAGREAYASIARVQILSDIAISLYEAGSAKVDSLRLTYKSPDSYINLRNSPNGAIIAQIKRSDVAADFGGAASNGTGARLYYAGERAAHWRAVGKKSSGASQSNSESGDSARDSSQDSAFWLGVFYFPSGSKSPIFGYIHETQVSFAYYLE